MFVGYLYHGPIQAIIILAILWNYFGYACLAGFGVLILFIPFQGMMGRLFGRVRRNTAGLTDERIRVMSEIISGMRVIKMYSWEEAFSDLINNIRK